VTQVTPSTASPLVKQWRDLARHYAQISCRLDKALHERHGLGMSEFEILDRLVEGGKDCVRMQELGEAVHLSQSALSRAVARLDKEGLVDREMCDMDRRGVFVRLTDAGWGRWQEASPTHREVVEESLADF
jgi:DNA-binding MarR family transcriptional regulator